MKELFAVVQWTEYEGDFTSYFFDIYEAVKFYSKRTSGPISGVSLIRYYEKDNNVAEQMILAKHNRRQVFSRLKEYFDNDYKSSK